MADSVSDEPRTEQQIVADTAWRLFDQGLLDQKPELIARVCRLLHIPVAELREARVRLLRGYVSPTNRTLRVKPKPKRAATRKRPIRDGKLWCRRHNGWAGEWLPAEEFALRADRSGHRRPWCRDCTRIYHQRRWLSAEQLSHLEAFGFLELEPSDISGDHCPVCGNVFAARERVRVWDLVVVHDRCSRAPAEAAS